MIESRTFIHHDEGSSLIKRDGSRIKGNEITRLVLDPEGIPVYVICIIQPTPAEVASSSAPEPAVVDEGNGAALQSDTSGTSASEASEVRSMSLEDSPDSLLIGAPAAMPVVVLPLKDTADPFGFLESEPSAPVASYDEIGRLEADSDALRWPGDPDASHLLDINDRLLAPSPVWEQSPQLCDGLQSP